MGKSGELDTSIVGKPGVQSDKLLHFITCVTTHSGGQAETRTPIDRHDPLRNTMQELPHIG